MAKMFSAKLSNLENEINKLEATRIKAATEQSSTNEKIETLEKRINELDSKINQMINELTTILNNYGNAISVFRK